MTPSTIKVNFEHPIRRAHVYVEAEAWHDEDGIYKVAIVSIWMDGAEVSDLLTDADILEIESAIEPAIYADAVDDAIMAFNPDRDAHRLGD